MINRHNQPWSLAPRPTLEWRGDTPCSAEFNDIYFSPENGLAETDYVFLEGVGFAARCRALDRGERLVLTETGFGTGLNFLATVCEWRERRPTDARLHYIGIDAFPMRRVDVQRALSAYPALSTLSERLIQEWPVAIRGCHRLCWPDWGITLDLWWETAEDALADLSSHGQRWVDLWYLDGFAPARSTDMWSDTVFEYIGQLSRPQARFATFTAAGDVRRGLTASGFEVSKRSGFGRKRDCLTGRYSSTESDAATAWRTTPWDIHSNACIPNALQETQQPKRALVIGAGLAGAHAARSLAERGIEVTVLERSQIASGGSSNLQGLTYTRLSKRFAPLSDFALSSFVFSTRAYKARLNAGALSADDGEHCGFLQTSDDASSLDYLSTALADEAEFAAVLDAPDASETLGLALDSQALFYPDALWLYPAAVCHERLNHPAITILDNLGEVSLQATNIGWQAHWTGGSREGDVAILATAHDLRELPWTNWLPLQGIRGQTTHVAATSQSERLRTAFCHEGYLPPARKGLHCLGASYGPNDLSLDERNEDHEHNLHSLMRALPALEFPTDASRVSGHVALRCTSADYLPIAGPVPDKSQFNHCYAELSRQKTRRIPTPCPTVPGLWVLAALGSRGLTAAPLAAELIASQLCGEPIPVARYLQQALSPARFLQRALVRGTPL